MLTSETVIFIAIIGLANAVTIFAQRVLQARVSDYEYFAIGAPPAIATTLLLVVFVLFVPNVTDYLILQTVLTVATMVWALLRLRQRVDLRLIRPYAALGHLCRAAPTGLSMIGTILVPAATRPSWACARPRTRWACTRWRRRSPGCSSWWPRCSPCGLCLRIAPSSRTTTRRPWRAWRAVRVLAVALLALPLMGVSWVVLTYLLPDFASAFGPMVVLAVAAVASTTLPESCPGGLGMAKANRRLYVYAAASAAPCLPLLPARAYGAMGVAWRRWSSAPAGPHHRGRGALARAVAGSANLVGRPW